MEPSFLPAYHAPSGSAQPGDTTGDRSREGESASFILITCYRMGCLPNKLPYKLTVATICQHRNWAPGPGSSLWADLFMGDRAHGNAMVTPILPIFSSFLPLLHLHHVPTKCCFGRHGHYDCHGTAAAPGGDLVL